MNEMECNAGSCGDPRAGLVFDGGIHATGAADVDLVRSRGVLRSLTADGSAIAEHRIEPNRLPSGF